MITKEIKKLGDLLFVGAHPDDEVFCAAGVMAAAVRAGSRVACLTATRGEAGVRDEKRWPPGKLAQIRTAETGRSLGVLGVREHWWLDYADGKCAEADQAAAVKQVRGLIGRFRPDTVITFGPDGLTAHPDHQTVSSWVSQAVEGLKVRVLWIAITEAQYKAMREADRAGNIFFIEPPRLAKPDELALDFRLPEDLTELKRRAFAEVESQFEEILASRPLDKPGRGLARECFIDAKGGKSG